MMIVEVEIFRIVYKTDEKFIHVANDNVIIVVEKILVSIMYRLNDVSYLIIMNEEKIYDHKYV